MIQRLFLPKFILHLEGTLVFLLSILLYARFDSNWLSFALLFFLLDISIATYLIGTTVGAMTYNTAHAYLLPTALAIFGLLNVNTLAISLSLIWFAHCGFDRMLGFGLKYPTRFNDTHLNRV